MDELISDGELEHLKRLSRLEMGPEETARIKEDLNRVLEYFKLLEAVDVSGLKEMPRPIDLENILRDDVAEPGLSQEAALQLGVAVEEGFFQVPRLVE